MRNRLVSIAVIAVWLCSRIAFPQDSAWAAAGKVGTEGIGADLHLRMVPDILNLRLGGSFFPYSRSFREGGIDYEGELRLGAIPILFDAYPF